MELKFFIKEILTQIAEGIDLASAEVSKKGFIINPIADPSGAYIYKNGRRMIQQLEIDVAISLEGKEGNKQGLAVISGLFSMGKTNDQSTTSGSISRVKFNIPFSLPESGRQRGDIPPEPGSIRIANK